MAGRKSKIIMEHRRHLIARSLKRNPLLSFKPTAQGRGRIDVCTFFEGVPHEKHDIVDFFRKLIEQGKALLPLQDNIAMRKRLLKMKDEADLLNRTTGEHSLFLAWPFITIPRDGKKKPLSTALFFWGINITTENGEFVFQRSEDSVPRYNYILDAWLQKQHKRELPYITQEQSGDDEDDTDKGELFEATAAQEQFVDDENVADKGAFFAAIRKQIDDFCSQWQECDNQLTENSYELHAFSKHNGLLVSPHAVIGTANFKYMALLSDLKKLEDNADNEEQRTLLDEILGNRSPEISNPSENNVSCESEKYLVETSDVSQEKVVWQARKSKITFLDGPPGGGKSQTIVNLIADSLQRREKVMLVCHQQAALNVVKKRLGAVNLDGLSLLITNARTQRKPVIEGIKDILEHGDASRAGKENKRDIHGSNIEKLENSCNQITTSLSMGETEKHSIRGDLRGIMKKIERQTTFSPFDFRMEKFIKELSGNRIAREDNIEKLERFAQDYDTCGYDSNKWKNAGIAPKDVNNVSTQFSKLVDDAKKLDDMSQKLPKKKLLPLLFSDMMLAFATQFFSAEKKSAVSALSRLIEDTKRIFSLSKMPIPRIWEEVCTGNGSSIYKQYADDAVCLEQVASINEMKLKDQIIATFMQYQDNINVPMEKWKDVLESILCYQMYQKHSEEDMIMRERARCYEKLKSELEAKKIADAECILAMYLNRRYAAERLQNRGLLRERAHRRLKVKATTIRDIYHKSMEDVCMVYPALLTSPDTMSQILPLEAGIVDLAIIDEASQMFVADALPVLYRAKKIVISGDKMQMPPDDTFVSDDLEDEVDDDPGADVAPDIDLEVPGAAEQSYELMEVMENIIPPTSNARCNLSVHYRSRPEELIAFSNHTFYRGRLQAAPDNAIVKPPLKQPIEMIHAAGSFQDKINEQEADKIINILKKIWREDIPPSVGVIVFNVEQAKYVEKRISEEAERLEEFSEAYGRAKGQIDDGEDVGFFVRSVTHVQGDERDIIILGTTYDERSNNYGPLNKKEKGRRRLNVAVTRAKFGMYVVTSLNIERISSDGMRPGADGEGQERWFFWKFMKYAKSVSEGNQEKTAEILRSLNDKYEPRPIGQEPDSQFERDVGDYICALGDYEVDYQVGEGGFRIDIGVKKKGANGRYLCGIECDGRYWHEGWRARHNDVWRQEILEGKGWNIHRIWSDYWYSHRSEQAQLDLRKHLEERVKDMAK